MNQSTIDFSVIIQKSSIRTVALYVNFAHQKVLIPHASGPKTLVNRDGKKWQYRCHSIINFRDNGSFYKSYFWLFG